MEGVERRLQDQHDEITVKDTDKERRDTSVAEIPYEVEQIVTPPRALIRVLEGETVGLCGGRFQLTWESGEWKGLPVTGYCAEPLCTETGACTGTRFVPHVDQWNSTDPAVRSRRKMDKREMLASVRQFAHRASAQTGRDEDRTDREILDFVKTVWLRTLSSIRGGGGWTR